MTDKKDIARYADAAMFKAEPIEAAQGPQVFVLSMNPDPLGDAAAAISMYRGQVVRDLAEITDDQRREVLTSMRATKLKAPLEFIKMHFLIENVHRGFTHQMVRQRTAVYAQESMRFAVKEGMARAIHLPPSLAAFNDPAVREELIRRYEEGAVGGLYPVQLTKSEHHFITWWKATNAVELAYTELINTGMPAEEARGLAPTNVGTRLHYATDFRALLEHAGNRLCTQAQFEWRQVFAKISSAIVEFGQRQVYARPIDAPVRVERASSEWQFRELAAFFRPACYLTGKCEFAAMDLDRACKIRNRVDANHEIGRPSPDWDTTFDAVAGDPIVAGVGPQSVVRDENMRPVFIGAISPAEWLLDSAAARVQPGRP